MDSIKESLVRVVTKISIAGSEKLAAIHFDVANYPTNSLWYRAVQILSARSLVTPLANERVSTLRQIFKQRFDDGTLELLKLPSSSFSRETFHDFLRDMDLEIAQAHTWSDKRKYDNASIWRTFLTRPSDMLGDQSPVPDALHCYTSPLKALENRMIPVTPFGRTFSNNLVSAIKHDSAEDLLTQAADEVNGRLHSIAQACEVDIQNYEALCAYQEELLLIPISEDERAEAIALFSKHVHTDRWKSFDESHLAAIAIAYIDSVAYFPGSASGRLYDGAVLNLPSTSIISSQPMSVEYRYGRCSQPWFFARHRLPSVVMTAMFLLMLCRTGWNLGSLGQMTTDGIQRNEGRLVLQGFKTKTDDDTPTYKVRRNDLVLQKIVVMLERNLEQLIAHKKVPPGETRLWFGWQDLSPLQVKNHVGEACLDLFCGRHQIPRFAPSELRPLNAASTYLQEQDLRAVQLLLGHSTLDIAENYLNQTLFYHLNEAKALRYQRVIEATIVFATKGQAALISMKIDSRLVDNDLLFPTGDGGTCSNPFEPPVDLEKGHTICDGQRCHLHGGCPNYKLLVDARMLELALRTRELYRSRWVDMLNQNEANFKRIHIPRIVFIHVLLKVVAEKRPALLRSASAAFAKREEK